MSCTNVMRSSIYIHSVVILLRITQATHRLQAMKQVPCSSYFVEANDRFLSIKKSYNNNNNNNEMNVENTQYVQNTHTKIAIQTLENWCRDKNRVERNK